ncbi:MAG: hypothetical protein AB7O96_06975 [Pseudobdellovibrionaceae bacterium]
MKILTHSEREALKQNEDIENHHLARYHRFVASLFGASGFVVDAEDIPLTFDRYKKLLMDFPEWSYPPIRPGSRHWRSEFYANPPEINRLYLKAWKDREYLRAKYPAIVAADDDIVI